MIAAQGARGSSASSFHYSFGLLPAAERTAIEAVYAFCRAIDDVVDERPQGSAEAAAELESYRADVGLCYAGEPQRPVTRRLQEAVRRFGIPREPLDDLIDGVTMDLQRTRYATFDELRVYCRRVASAVGLACLSIFGCRHPRSRAYAVELGVALQLVNILRDLGADAARGRIYVPAEDIAAFGYSEDELLRGVRSSAYIALMRHQAGRARRQFEIAGALLPDADRPRLLAAEVMAAIYRRLLRRIEARQFRVFDRRVGVPRLSQIGEALRVRLRGRIGR